MRVASYQSACFFGAPTASIIAIADDGPSFLICASSLRDTLVESLARCGTRMTFTDSEADIAAPISGLCGEIFMSNFS
ncbi:hypothetical protein [Candidatus Ichthyocystis hellenicum]|uniref:hypothetical protein n=1 Tax=Candidatus Ichthyocystis hellenicum TaxID=1561003 RepID=UPI001111E7C6|nr:hypothetical protein [Candidatus Ichthyocystis hellenicum]